MMTNAGENTDERGRLNGWDDEDVAAALDMDGEHVTAIREAMQGKTLNGDQLSGWNKRQPKREDDSAERAKKWRDNKNKQLHDANATERTRTQPNAEKRPDTDTDTEILSSNEDNTREPTARDVLLECLSEKTAADVIAHRQAKKSKLTPRAARELVNAFQKFGDPEAAAAEMILRGWTGFKPDWMVQATSPPGSNVTQFGKPKERDLRNVPDTLLSADDYWKKRKQLKEWA
jgi:hypothetical protein